MRLTKHNLQKLTPDDRNEVEAFQELLRDMDARMPIDALWEKWGEAYLGPKPVRFPAPGAGHGGTEE